MHFSKLEDLLDEDGIVFLSYGGFMTQALISGMTDALEREVENNDLSMKVSSNIFTIFIELSQNMMNYAKTHPLLNNGNAKGKGLIVVGMSRDEKSFYIISRNPVLAADKQKIEARLNEIEGLDKEELRALYRRKRKEGKDLHQHGAGIGFIEIARRCTEIEHHFQPIDDGKYYFTVKTSVDK